MYALAMVLGIVSSTFAWRLLADEPERSRQNIIGYGISAALCLYTLYFSILLLLAHFLWAVWCKCRREQLRDFIYAGAIAFILYLPWLLYTTPKLILYVTDKVSVEKDIPLELLDYLWRHLWAFVNGHIPIHLPLGTLQNIDQWNTLAHIGPLAAILLLLISVVRQYYLPQYLCRQDAKNLNPMHLLFALLIIPSLGGFIINYLWPFFPIGGERMLLFILPYFLLLLAVTIDRGFISRYTYIIWSTLIGLLLCSGLAITTFYTTPRHIENDYRPLIRQIVQQGRAADTVLTLFPWQVGYWRAYVPNRLQKGQEQNSPQPLLVNDGIIEWGDGLIDAIDQALEQGTLWFPEPRAFGSTLPTAIENYLSPRTTNLADRWYTPTTLLSAWHISSEMGKQGFDVDFGQIHLEAFSVQTTAVASANQPLHVGLWWNPADLYNGTGLYATLRLQDAQGHTWASRDYPLSGSLGSTADRIGLIVPAGLVPGMYRLMLGVGHGENETLMTIIDKQETLVQLAQVHITEPIKALSEFQLPIQRRLNSPASHNGLLLLGSSGTTPNTRLAGTEIALTLFFKNQEPLMTEHHIYVSVLDSSGKGVGGWQGWTLPNYPITQWPPHALVQVPVRFPLPATLKTGSYRLVAGLVNPKNGEKTPITLLDRLTIEQRPADFTPTQPMYSLEQPVQFGTHVQLQGYDYEHNTNDETPNVLRLTLHWAVMQTLLPDHHIFVHINRTQNSNIEHSATGNNNASDNDSSNGNDSTNARKQATIVVAGTTIVQDDGPPVYDDQPIPSGSWLPGEYLQTTHTIMLPPDVRLSNGEFYLNVGLYEPFSLVRLPATIDDQSTGDSALLQP